MPYILAAAASLLATAWTSAIRAAELQTFIAPAFDQPPNDVVETRYQGQTGWAFVGPFRAIGEFRADALVFVSTDGTPSRIDPNLIGDGSALESVAALPTEKGLNLITAERFYLKFFNGKEWSREFLPPTFFCNAVVGNATGPGYPGLREGPIVATLDDGSGPALFSLDNDRFMKHTGDVFEGEGEAGVLALDFVERAAGSDILAAGGLPLCDSDRSYPFVSSWNGSNWDRGWGGDLPFDPEADARVIDIATFGVTGNQQVAVLIDDDLRRVLISDGTLWSRVDSPLALKQLSTQTFDQSRVLLGWGTDPATAEVVSLRYDDPGWSEIPVPFSTRLNTVVERAEANAPLALVDRFEAEGQVTPSPAVMIDDEWRPLLPNKPEHQGLNGSVEQMTAVFDGDAEALYVVGGDITLAGTTAVTQIARWNGADWAALPPLPEASDPDACCDPSGWSIAAREEAGDEIFYLSRGARDEGWLRHDTGGWSLIPLPRGELSGSVVSFAFVEGDPAVYLSLRLGAEDPVRDGVWALQDGEYTRIAETDRAPLLKGGTLDGDFRLLALGRFTQINDAPFLGRAVWNGSTWQPLDGPEANAPGQPAACTRGSLNRFFEPTANIVGGSGNFRFVVAREVDRWEKLLEVRTDFGDRLYSITAGCVALGERYLAVSGRSYGQPRVPVLLSRLFLDGSVPMNLPLDGSTHHFARTQGVEPRLYLSGDFRLVDGAPSTGLAALYVDRIFTAGHFETQ